MRGARRWKPELLNNSGDWFSGEVGRIAPEVFGSAGMAPGATQESATDEISFVA
jgi:hypothetical protein